MTGEPMTLAPGDVLARKYRLLEPLGEGGMAEVWVALNIALDTKVAIKVLRATLSNDPRLVARVRQEAKATAAIAHKNIVQVYDYGVTGWGAPFIVMEFLRGETLAQRLKERGRLRPTEAARVLLRAMKGVTVAHAKGIIHRDLKPENIFIAIEDNGNERPKVLDFGVSSVMREGGDERSRSGGMVGTPAYLPPEMIQEDSRGDARSDVWALGVILYETLTGRLPFEGDTTHQLLEGICRNPPPPMVELPRVDARLEAIVSRALAKKPADRYPGVRELFDDLNHWLGEKEAAVTLSVPRMSATFGLPSDPHTDDEGPTIVGPSLEPPVDRPDRDSDRPINSSPAPPTASSRPSMRAAQPVTPRSNVTYVAAAAGAVVMVAAVLGYVGRRTTTPATASGPVVVVAAPAAPADSPMLDILSLPEGAVVFVDGDEVTLPRPMRRGSTVHVRVESPAFLPWTQDVSAEGSVRLTYAGVPRPASSAQKVWPRPPPKPPGDYKEVPYLPEGRGPSVARRGGRREAGRDEAILRRPAAFGGHGGIFGRPRQSGVGSRRRNECERSVSVSPWRSRWSSPPCRRGQPTLR